MHTARVLIIIAPNLVIAIRHHSVVIGLTFLVSACGADAPARDVTVEAPAQVAPAAPPPAALPAAAPPAAVTRREPKLVDIALPKLKGRINDYAKILGPSEVTGLERTLAAHERATGQQFALLTMPTLNGVDAADFAFSVASRWKLGRKDQNDGLLLLVALAERQADIEVGIGLESAIPNALAANVIREQLTPAFREQKYAAGLRDAFDRLIAAARPQSPVPR